MSNWLEVADVKALQAITGTASDAQIAALIPACQAWLESIRVVEAREITRAYDGTGTCELVLRDRPVIAAEDVTVIWDPARAFTGVDPMPAELYAVDYDAGIVSLDSADDFTTWDRMTRMGDVWPEGKGTIQVTATFGYATIPEDLKLLLSELVALKVRTTGSEGKASETIGAYSYTLADSSALTPLSRGLWDRYFAGVGTDVAR